MQYNQRKVGFIKFLISLPFMVVSILPFFSFSVFIATSMWVAFMLPLYILAMIYFIVYGYKCLQMDNSAITTLVILFLAVAFNLVFQNSLSYQVYLITLSIAFSIQCVQGMGLIIRSRNKIYF
ncbi:MAG: hypothetical protein ACRCV7_06475 [Culicoidibacterales bacterium]